MEADKKNPFPTENVRFTGNIQPGREEVQYQFNFGDGTRSEWLHESVASHTYTNPGTYNARLTAWIGEELFQSNDCVITVEMVTIRAFLEAEPSQSEAGRTVIFRASLEPNIGRAEYRFFFGDGGVRDWSYETLAGHIYAEPGNYHAYVVSRVDQKNISESNPVRITVIRVIHGAYGKLLIAISAGLLMFSGGGCYIFLRIKRLRKIGKQITPTVQVKPHKDTGRKCVVSNLDRLSENSMAILNVCYMLSNINIINQYIV